MANLPTISPERTASRPKRGEKITIYATNHTATTKPKDPVIRQIANRIEPDRWFVYDREGNGYVVEPGEAGEWREIKNETPRR